MVLKCKTCIICAHSCIKLVFVMLALLFQVGYAVGSRGLPLPDVCLSALDDGFIPLTHEASSSLHAEDDPVVFELIFSVLDMRPSWKVVSK